MKRFALSSNLPLVAADVRRRTVSLRNPARLLTSAVTVPAFQSRHLAGSMFVPSLARACAWVAQVMAVGLGMMLTGVAVAATSSPPARVPQFGSLPLYFEPNQGQTAAPYEFISRTRGSTLLLGPAEAMLTLAHATDAANPIRSVDRIAMRRALDTRSVIMTLVGADRQARMDGEGRLPGRINYLLGSEPARWQTELPIYERIRAREVYPGVDVVYYGNEHRLEYDFEVAPGVSPDVIRLQFTGADALQLADNGDLILKLGTRQIRQLRPVAYQLTAAGRRGVTARYRILHTQQVTIEVGDYDPERLLVIDPILSYSTFLGGSALDIAWDVALDPAGYVYVAGETLSATLPTTPGAFRTNYASGSSVGGDVFVAKFNPAVTALEYLTYLGGQGDDAAYALAVDPAGQVFLTGFTTSTDFPVTGIQTNLSGKAEPNFGMFPSAAFVTALNAAGSGLVYSTYLGGSSNDLGIAVAVDSRGHAYVTGLTRSTNFPTVATTRTQSAGRDEAFVTAINSTGTALVYSTYLGGTNNDAGQGIAVDEGFAVYVTGYTASTNFPTTTNAWSRLLNTATNAGTSFDAFLVRFEPDSSVMSYASYFGGLVNDVPFRLTLDAQTNVFLAGYTLSLNFPRTATNLPSGLVSNSLASDLFVSRFDATLTNLIYSVVLGGTGNDEAWDVAVDARGHAHVVGVTGSTNFPVVNGLTGFATTNLGGLDAFVLELDATGTNLVYSVYLGGSANDYGYAIETDPAGNAYVVGRTFSTNFPTVAAYQAVFGGTADAFLAKIVNEPQLDAARAGADVVVSWPAFLPEFSLQTITNLSVLSNWTPVEVTPGLLNGRHTVTVDATNAAEFFRLQGP